MKRNYLIYIKNKKKQRGLVSNSILWPQTNLTSKLSSQI